MIPSISKLSRGLLLLTLTALALSACDSSSSSRRLNSSSGVVSPGEASITSISVTADQATVDWQLSSGALAEQWRLYQNTQRVCSGEPTAVASSGNSTYQSGGCTTDLQSGSNSFYVQLCNFDSSGSSLCSQSTSEIIDYQEQTELGAIYLQDIPNSTSDSQIYVSWLKEQGANGDHWRIYHNDAQVCSGNLLYNEDSFVQSDGCDITLEVGTNKFQAELCQAQPVGIDDICAYSAALSTTFSEDSARSLATPYVVDPEELLPARYDISIAWIKDTSSGSAGEDWSMSNNGSEACEDTLAGDASNASCVLSLVEGTNLLQVRLCTDTATYSGASCKSSAIVKVEAFDPNPLEPGIIDITNNVAQLTYSPSLALEWRIVSGNDVSSWSVDHNGEQHCATSSADKYYSSGYCLLDLALGDNIISVTGCNYGYDNSESCSSAEVSTEYVVVPGIPELTSSFPATTYDSGHTLSWERFDGEAADYWLAMVNDTSKCSYDLPKQTPQSDSCTIQLDSGFNIITARLCLANESGSAYCSDSAAEQVELLAPVPAHPEISTPAQTIADDIILLEWSKSSGDNGSYWSVINNGVSVSACSDQPLLSSGSSQSGDCNLPLELGANVVSVHLCNNNAAGTSSCTASASVTIIRESAPPELTSATIATSAENNSAVFYTATVSDNDSSATQISFSLSGADGALFTINSSGGLAFSAAADYESPQDADGDNLYQLSIIATDQTSLTDQLDFSVSVTNVNDIAPEFSSVASVSVVENSSGVIHSAQASDAEGDDLAYYLSGADASYFSLNSSSGELALLSSLDYESPQDQDRDNIYQFDLSASDSAHSTVQAFSVELSDSNDESPQATSLQSIALDLSSISLGVTIYTVTASDPDAGDQLSYSHSGADASHFSLDSNSGDLAFIVLPSGADSDPLDANGDGVYQLDISISDLALNSSSFALTVAVADDVGMYPRFDLRHDSASIPENSSASFYTAVAVDPEGESVYYSLSGADSSHFIIDSVSGELRPIAPLDYENPLDSGLDNNYSLTILASDPLGNQSQQTLDVLVSNANDNEPSFSAPSASVSVTENHTTSVYSADASDADGDSLIYSISGTDAGHFSIDSSSGALAFSTLPDYENPQDSNGDNTYELTVTASDSATSAEQSLSIVVEDSNDNSPSFSVASDSLSVSENGATLLYTALATDADAGDQVSYSLAGADASQFSLDHASGALSSLSPFDFETPLDIDGDNTYELDIVASDGSNSSILPLSISVSNLNDNLPSFAVASDILSVSENTSGIIYTATATDLDGANSLAYSLQGADANDFSIDPASGALAFQQAPDYEQPRDSNQDNQYELEIRASDGINSASLALQVVVSNVSDIAPMFAYSSYSVEFTENATGTVYIAVASDSEGDSITYGIQGSDASYFSIDSVSGILTFNISPDFEKPTDQDRDNHYQLDIAASDGANSTSLALTVAVQDINDNAPSFAAASDSISVSENTSATIYTATAADPDTTDSLAYSLSGADAHLFTINSSSGALAFSIASDFESPTDQNLDNRYQLDIAATDSAHSTSIALTVVIEDSNDNAPSFALESHSLDVAENTGGTIYTAAATDPDAIDSLTYSLQGTDAHNFSIHHSSGALAFYRAPDYEQPTDQNGDQRYHLEVQASDGTYSAILSLTVEVSNLNDNAPSFAAATKSLELPESSSGIVYSATASDLDGDAITYSISGTDSSLFTINSSSGALTPASALDFESPQDQDSDNTYELEIAASDGVSSASLTLSIELSDVNDNAPSFGQSSEALIIPENSSGIFYTAVASDLDATDSLSYSLQGIDAHHFSVNAGSGELALPNALDFENPLDQGGDNIYELSISASDGAHSAALGLTITVEDRNDNGPSFALISDVVTVAENSSGSIYTASASTLSGDPITYSLGGADASYFSLNSSSGALSLLSALDFESPLDQNSDNHYQLEIAADDGGSSSAILSLTVELSDVNDNSPSFAAPSDSITVAENTSTSFYTASASDPDATASLSYSLSGVDASLLTIDPISGELAFRSAPDFDNPLDSDKGNDYELDIGVSDGTNSASLQLTVRVSNVNDSTPVFTSAPSQVVFSETSSASVYTAAATDPDADSITYSVVGIDASFFSMEPSSGVLSFHNQPDFESPQDQDGNNDYELEIQASDGLNATSFNLIVSVEDANDNAPVFALAADSVSVLENTTSSVYVAAATDSDAIDIITYSLSGSDAQWLTIDPSGGAIAFASPPDYEAAQDSNQDNIYELIINASDGANANSASQELNVSVSNLSDSTPVFSTATDSVALAENSSGVVYTAQATDPDGDSLSYSLNGSDASSFRIDSVSGALSFASPPDFETPQDADQDNIYELHISASDGISAVSASLDLLVSVSDVNDNQPQFPQSTESISVFEDSYGIIYTAQATDADTGDSITYSISGTDASLLTINSSSGALTFLSPPDFENPSDADANNIYELIISASDGSNSAELSLKATIINLNDSAPRFAAMSDSAVADENSAASFYTAAATDPEGSTLSYALRGGDAALFSIDSASGAIAFLAPPDFESPSGQYADNSYEFNITADDATYLGEMILIVTVADLNDNAPSFSPDSASATLAENSTDVFYQAAATDPDTVGALTYSLTGTDAAAFAIDPVSGELSATTGLDFEQPSDADQANTYELEITAADGIASASLALTVAVSNVNDTAPVFSVATESVDFTENSSAIVYTAMATDPEGDTPSYSVSGTDSALFSIDPNSGALSFKTPPDFEAATDHNSDNTYELNVSASDGVNSASLALAVAVQDINDNSPSFTASNESISVAENNASSIYKAQATDIDATDILTYSISGSDSGKFSINSVSGALAFNSAPDFEKPGDSNQDNAYELSITASDGTNQGAQALAITVTNVNEPLSFTTTSVNLTTAENNLSFTHIVEAALDEDQGQQLSYQLSGADQSAFSLDSATRALSFANTPDYENPADQDSNNAYQVDIIASDGEYESSQSIAISISDVNDEAPQFTSSDLQTVDYAMVQVGDVVYTAAATDADAGDQISFSISGADATNFDFDSSTGELSFKQLTAPADAPANGIITYNLTITATDLAGNSSDLAFSISVIYNIPPTSSISAVQSAYEGDIVELDGSASSDADGSIASYFWQQIDSSGYSVNLSDSSITKPSFTVPEVTAANIELIFELIVTDNEGSTGSASVSISIIYNNPPVAEAGDDQDIFEGSLVELDASASSDTDGSIVSYSWQQIDNSGHSITLSDPSTTKPSFTAPKVAAGTSLILIFELTVTDDRGKSSQDSITLSLIYNNPPIADAGQNFAADEGISVALDGSASSDSEDSTLAYFWQQVDSSGYAITLDDPSSATPSFTTPIVGADIELIFQLTVTDSLGKSSDANVSISVIYNIPPIADAGTDQTVYEGDSVALDGSSSSDSDGSTLTYLWQQVDSSGYAITLNNADTAKPTFITPNPIGADTDLIFQLTVTDSLGKSADANATISVIYNHPPIADVGSDQTVHEGDSVGLDGSASSDSEGTALTYLWQQVDSSGYAITLNNADTAKPTFIAPNPVAADTDLIFQLTVTDGFGKSADANATISVIYNHPPVANAGTDRTVFESITITLDGNASSDSENSSLSYFWQQLDSSGHSVNLSDATAAQPTFTAPDVDIDVEAYIELIFQLTVTDERGKSSNAIVTLTVVNNEPPIADAGADHTLYESNTVQLDGSSSSDIEDTSLNYSWQQIDSSGYSVSFSDATSAQPSFIAPDVTADANLTFQLTVTDAGSKSSTDTVTITVLYAPTFTVSVSPDNTQVVGTIASLRGATQGSHLIESYLWEETTDYGLAIDRADSTNASFVVPDYLYANYDVLSFQFTATDAAGISVSATTVINIGVASNLKWHYDIDSKVNSSPAIGPDGAVYFGAGEKTFHVVYSEDGSLKWKFIAENSFEAPPTIGADGTVYIGDVGGILYALTAPTDGSQSGIEKWRYEFASHSFTEYSSVSIAADGTLHIGASDGFLYALDPDSGTLKWSYELEHNGDAILASTAISSEGNIYFASALGHMYAVKPPSDGGSTGELYWRYDTRAYATWTNPAIDDYGYVYNGSWGDGMYQFDYRSGRYIYRFPANKDVHASAAIGAGDIIYFGSEDDKMYAYNARGRNREWKYETGSDSIYSSGGGDIFSAPVIGANGRLYFGSADDYVYALDAAKGEYKWAHDVMGTRWNDDQDVKNSIAKNSSPALAPDGTLFIGVGDGLYAIHTRAPGLAADAPWPKFGQNNLNTGRANLKPSADAGSEQTVAAGATVNLDASASSDPDGAIINYYWRETSGYGIHIIGNSSAQARFTAPTLSGNYTLTIELVVTDNHGRTATTSVNINIEI